MKIMHLPAVANPSNSYSTVLLLQLHTHVLPHACFSVDKEIIMHVPTNSHACKSRMIPTRAVFKHVPYIF